MKHLKDSLKEWIILEVVIKSFYLWNYRSGWRNWIQSIGFQFCQIVDLFNQFTYGESQCLRRHHRIYWCYSKARVASPISLPRLRVGFVFHKMSCLEKPRFKTQCKEIGISSSFESVASLTSNLYWMTIILLQLIREYNAINIGYLSIGLGE